MARRPRGADLRLEEEDPKGSAPPMPCVIGRQRADARSLIHLVRRPYARRQIRIYVWRLRDEWKREAVRNRVQFQPTEQPPRRHRTMLTVHHLETSRSQRILWLLEELGVPYELKVYKRDSKTRLAPPELKAIH